MKRIICFLLAITALSFYAPPSHAQAIKINAPLALVGTANLGAEFTLTQQLSVNGDVLWMPYLFKKNEEVFRTLVGSADLRYYVKPRYYYTNDMFDGFYLGPYVMLGDFNIGLKNGDDAVESYRHKGWGVSAGISFGYKFYLSPRFRLDINMGVGYAHLQYDKFLLGGEWADYPLEIKNTKAWIGPTKFGIHLVYNIFR